jgi:hypothetical protein
MIRFATATCVLASLLAAPLACAAEPTLAGRTFTVDLKDPSGKSQSDTLVFTATDADSLACHAYGFGKSTVTYASGAEGMIGFAFVAKSDKGGTMDWKGWVKGDHIEGSTISTMEGKETKMTFSGSETKAGAEKTEKHAKNEK